MTRVVAKAGTGFVLALVLASCASVSIDEDGGTEHNTPKMPEMIYVMAFTTRHGDFNVDRAGAELADFKQNLQDMLKTAMVDDLYNRLIPAEPGKKSDWSRHKNAWIIRGQFTTVDQGSRLLRTAIGFGAGRTTIETNVEVYDLVSRSGVPFLTFATTGGSGAQPGELIPTTVNPVLIGLSLASHASHGLTEDTKRTAREITAELSDYMYRRGWIPQDKWIEPKQLDANNEW